MSLAQVKEFHEAFGHPTPSENTLITPERFALRIALIEEELEETVRDYLNKDIIKVADGLADLRVVTFGTMLEFGIRDYAGDPNFPSPTEGHYPALRDFRYVLSFAEMIEEEIRELKEAYNSSLSEYNKIISATVHLHRIKRIVFQTAHELSIPLVKVEEAVHKANMSKLGADGKPIYRESDNKILKGPNFRPPEEDIEAILREHGAEL